MSKFEEVLRASRNLGIDSRLLSDQEGAAYVDFVLTRYRPKKTSGHLSIYHDSVSIPLQEHEFTYPLYLGYEAAFVFFEQYGPDKDKVVMLEEGQKLGTVLIDCYGFEYFVSNQKADYLLAVNWYVIEGAGIAIDWLNQLRV